MTCEYNLIMHCFHERRGDQWKRVKRRSVISGNDATRHVAPPPSPRKILYIRRRQAFSIYVAPSFATCRYIEVNPQIVLILLLPSLAEQKMPTTAATNIYDQRQRRITVYCAREQRACGLLIVSLEEVGIVLVTDVAPWLCVIDLFKRKASAQ